MSGDAYAIWHAAEGRSVQKSVRTFWPDLAAALDGRGRPAPAEAEAERRADIPDCSVASAFCKGKAAGVFDDDKSPTCFLCRSTGHNYTRPFTANPEWPRR